MVEVTACLDSWAVIAWLRGEEPAAERVARAIDAGAVMSWISAGEVFYLTLRRHGAEQGRRVLDNLRLRTSLDEVGPDRILEAATIKGAHRMSYADAFACATAIAYDAPLLTGDDEILRAAGPWVAQDVRRS